jgi:uncharacterized protein
MAKTINKSIKEYIALLRKNYSDIECIYLFGSYSKGKATEDSDIDIALVFKELDDSARFDLQVKLMMLASRIDTRIEPHPISLDDFNSGNPFVNEIKMNGLKIEPDITVA